MDQEDSQAAALGHIRVLDLSRVLAGPWAAQSLADLGAEVIKVESPRGGDDTRRWGPPFIKTADGTRGDAAYYTTANRNKSSVTIDFSASEGAELVREMASRSDVLIENFKLGGLRKYGLDYDSIRAVNPGIVYCSITGFGQDGPYAGRPGYDFLIQGMGGLMSITGQPPGTPGGEPVKVGVAVCDLFTGMYATVSILAALTWRDRTGEGQHIDCALLDAQVAMLANQASNWLAGGVVPEPMGNNHPNVVPYRAYPTSDGHVIITCGNDSQFQRLCGALGVDDMAANPKFRTNEDRIVNRDALDARLTALLSGFTRAEAIEKLEAVRVPIGPINALPDVFADPHVKARALEVPTRRPDGTEIPVVAYPARLNRTPATYRKAPPALGDDTDEVLSKLTELSPDEIADLRKRGII